MTRPLSIFLYYARNKRKALPLLIILALAVFGISLSLVLSGAMFESARSFASPFAHVIVIEPNYNKRYTQIDPALRSEIRRNARAANVLPVQLQYTYGLAIGNRVGFPLFGVDDDALPLLLAATGARVIAGHLPTSRADQVALHASVAKSRGLWAGDFIGRDVDIDDALAGKWEIVGILDGETVLNVIPLERVTQRRPASGMLLIPHPGEMRALAAELDALETDRVVIETPAYWMRFLDRVLGQIDTILAAINIVIVVVLSLGVGLLNMIYFRQRVGELALLAGIGFSKFFLLRRVTLEALVLTAAAWLLGMAISAAVYRLLNVWVFEPQGVALNLLNPRAVAGTLPVPIFVWLFSTLTVAWQLARLDPVAVIDRRD